MQFNDRSRTKVVQNEPLSFHLALLRFVPGLDPFEQMIKTVAATKPFRRRQGRGGARRTISIVSVLVLKL